MAEIMRAHRWGTNAKMIADVARLGHIEGLVLDATYGEAGGFWKEWRPEVLLRNDLNAEDVDTRYDFRDIPLPDVSIATVVYDPPYKLNGTPAMGEMDQRFGTGEYMTLAEKLAMIEDGAVECWRITERRLLVKCMDQVVSGRMCWQTQRITNLLVDKGARLIDRFDLLTVPRPQPGDRGQQHARSNYSTLLVFGPA